MNFNIIGALRNFYNDSKRIISISYKPSTDEFNKSAKIILLGILIIGVLGLILAVIISLIITGTLSLV
ncbi:MAG: protein translocase SEC61 complex subunit gamma [Candidatus Micrarchaeaceae archaeon]